MPTGCRVDVLERMLAVQRLDMLDAEGAHVLLEELLQRGVDGRPSGTAAVAPPSGVPGGKTSDAPLPSALQSKAPKLQPLGSSAPPAAPAGGSDEELPGGVLSSAGPAAADEAAHRAELARLRALPQAEACAALRAYLTAAAAKDCSVMVALQVLPAPAQAADPAQGLALPVGVAGDSPASAGAAADPASGPAPHEGSPGVAPVSATPRAPAPLSSPAEGGAPDALLVETEPDASGSGHTSDLHSGPAAPSLVIVRQTDATLGGVIEAAGAGGRRMRLRFKVAMADLDAKRLAKVKEHWRLDQCIMQLAVGAAETGAWKAEQS